MLVLAKMTQHFKHLVPERYGRGGEVKDAHIKTTMSSLRYVLKEFIHSEKPAMLQNISECTKQQEPDLTFH